LDREPGQVLGLGLRQVEGEERLGVSPVRFHGKACFLFFGSHEPISIIQTVQLVANKKIMSESKLDKKASGGGLGEPLFDP
jgi:hypothetical protein